MRIPNSSAVISISDPAVEADAIANPRRNDHASCLINGSSHAIIIPSEAHFAALLRSIGKVQGYRLRPARIAPAILDALSFSLRYEVSTSRCIAVHSPEAMDLILGHAGKNELIDVRAGDVETQCWAVLLDPRAGGGARNQRSIR